MSEGFFFSFFSFFSVKPRLEIQPGIGSGVLSPGLGCAGAAGGEVLPPASNIMCSLVQIYL